VHITATHRGCSDGTCPAVHDTDDPALATLARDFWLFDADAARPFAALMNYDHAGAYLGAAVTTGQP
jgi:hypothetical protein